jgi:hypothetical protein
MWKSSSLLTSGADDAVIAWTYTQSWNLYFCWQSGQFFVIVLVNEDNKFVSD